APGAVGEATGPMGRRPRAVGDRDDHRRVRPAAVGGTGEVPRASRARSLRGACGRRPRARAGGRRRRGGARGRRLHAPPRAAGAPAGYMTGVTAGLPSRTARQFFMASIDIAIRVSSDALAMWGAITTLVSGTSPGWMVGS